MVFTRYSCKFIFFFICNLIINSKITIFFYFSCQVIHFKRFRQQQLKNPTAAKLTNLVKFPIAGFDMSPHMARGPSNLPNDTHPEIICEERNSSSDNQTPFNRSSSEYRSQGDSFPQIDTRYDLYAVCYHQGETLETGHYTAACKNPYDHQWYKFDDQRINHIPHENIPEDLVNNEAYILFYQKRTVDNSECSGNSSSSVNHWITKMGASTVPSNSTASVKSMDMIGDKVTDIKTEVVIEVKPSINESLECEVNILVNIAFITCVIITFFFRRDHLLKKLQMKNL